MSMCFAVVDVECNEPVALYHTIDQANYDLHECGYDQDPRYEVMPMESDDITAYRLDIIAKCAS